MDAARQAVGSVSAATSHSKRTLEESKDRENPSTPPRSRASSSSSLAAGRKSPRLSIDLSDLPALSQPAPPSNTLLITNLQDPAIFAPTTLAHVRELITEHSPSGIHTFSPLRGMQRIIVTFFDIDSAVNIRSHLDGESLYGSRIRVYFGEPTPIQALSDKERHLQAPKSSKQFFISPPPSPPHGWESKEEDPPNKLVHPDDLATALESLNRRKEAVDTTPVPVLSNLTASSPSQESRPISGRSRSSTLVFNPEEHGKSPDLPAIAVEDTSDDDEIDSAVAAGLVAGDDETAVDADEVRERVPIQQQKTSRPPVELMHHA